MKQLKNVMGFLFQEMATVVASGLFVPVGDANVLRGAMKGIGTSEQEIIDVLCRRTNSQRQTISAVYTKQFERVPHHIHPPKLVANNWP